MTKIGLDKELADSKRLSLLIGEDKWIDSHTIIVCCSPDYSSLTCQLLNHSLSHLNKNELYDQLFMEMPYPTMSQVWDRNSGDYIYYDRYLTKWVVENIRDGYKYLFVDSAVLRGKNFSKVKASLSNKIDSSKVRFASLYVQENSVFTPDYYVEKVDSPIFEWENPLNPNWNY